MLFLWHTVPGLLFFPDSYSTENVIFRWCSEHCTGFAFFPDSYSTENVIFRWHPDPVQRNTESSLPQFQFIKFETMDCTKVYIGGETERSKLCPLRGTPGWTLHSVFFLRSSIGVLAYVTVFIPPPLGQPHSVFGGKIKCMMVIFVFP